MNYSQLKFMKWQSWFFPNCNSQLKSRLCDGAGLKERGAMIWTSSWKLMLNSMEVGWVLGRFLFFLFFFGCPPLYWQENGGYWSCEMRTAALRDSHFRVTSNFHVMLSIFPQFSSLAGNNPFEYIYIHVYCFHCHCINLKAAPFSWFVSKQRPQEKHHFLNHATNFNRMNGFYNLPGCVA